MHVLWDHTNAMVIGGVVLLILLGIQDRARQARTEATLYYMARSEAFAFIETLERDLLNIGSRVPTGEAKLLSADSTHLIFRRRFEIDGPIRTIRYVCQPAREAPEGRPLYEVRRYVDDNPAGQSPGMLARFRFDLLDEAGQPTQDLAAVRQIRVYMAVAYPFGQRGHLPHTRWHAVYRPRALARP